jgi:DNA gyrase subunit A
VRKEDSIMQSSDLINELGTNFIEYAVAVNSDRAIPDSKSGLKPVAKRILWSAYEEGRMFSKPHVKSARIVGDVMGKYHPHGDSSIYAAMVRLSQAWTLRYPLIDFHGSNGNISGDGPAASRYTEARLSKIAEDGLLKGLKKKNVEFIPNYDETLEEPVTLPAIFPNLLCNPNEGIGVAMACKWAPHNLGEVAQAIYDYIDGNEPMLPGPDFPTGGIVINKDDIPAIMKTGHGSVKIRGKYRVEKNKIIFYEIPYNQTIEGILAEIGEVCEKKEIEGIVDAHDESNRKGLRIVISCGKGVNPESLINKIFAKTSLQTSFSYNQVALVGKTPTELNLKDCIKIYLDHNKDCLVRELNFDIAKAEARKEIVDGLLRALEDIDNIIALIKGSESSAAAKETLMAKYKFTENQAKAILAMRLSSLAKLEKVELNNEKAELEKNLAEWDATLKDENKQVEIIRTRLSELVKKYGDKRRTELAQIEIPAAEKEIKEVVPEDVVVVTTHSGLIKRIPAASFKVQHKGGRGVKSTDDAILSTIKTNTVDHMMIFTDSGKMYRTIVDNIPSGTNVSKGIPINTLVKIPTTEKVIGVTSLHRKSIPEYIIFVTKNGKVKKSLLEEYMKTNRNTGIIALKIQEGDSVQSVIFQDKEDLILITKNGMSIRIDTSKINPIGRTSMGIKGVSLKEGDEVVAALPVHKSTDQVAMITSAGLGKKVPVEQFTAQGRGGKGVIAYKLTEGAEVAGAAMVSDEDNILITGNYTTICISAKEIPQASKIASGSILIKNNKVTNVTKI